MKKVYILMALGLMAASAWAVPAYNKGVSVTQSDGTTITVYGHGDEFFHYLTNEAGETVELGADGMYHTVESVTPDVARMRRAASPSLQQVAPRRVGSFNAAPRGLVIIVNFSNKSCQSATTQSSMEEMFNGDNYKFNNAYGSAKKYFEDQSNGTYSPQFDVYGPVTLPNNMRYYGGNDSQGSDQRPAEMARDACFMVDTMYNVDFTRYDSDNDGEVDFVYIIYAGYGENVTGVTTDAIWPHQYQMYFAHNRYEQIDGVNLGTYACSAELEGNSGTTRCGIGTLCHEFSHVLGLPDYYDTDYGQNYQNSLLPGTWDVMSGGSYNGDSKYPCNYTVYEKACFGWATPTQLQRTQEVSLPADGQTYYYISKDGRAATTETTDTVYYIENRQKKNWDSCIEGHGMMIWRVRYDRDKWIGNCPNNTAGKPNYIFVPADGTYNGGDSGDPYPGTSRVSTYVVPNSIYSIVDISESNYIVNARFVAGCDGYGVTVNAPNVEVKDNDADGCWATGSTYVATYTVEKNYELDYFQVTMGGRELTAGTDYSYTRSSIRIPNITGDVVLNIYTNRIPFEHEHCMYYYWHANGPVEGESAVLSQIGWTIATEGSTYRGYDNEVYDRGAQFGSRSKTATSVQLSTDAFENCLISEVQVVASTATGGQGQLEVVIDGDAVGNRRGISETEGEYVFANSKEWHGNVTLRFIGLTKALFLKKIVLHFVDEQDNPAGIEEVVANSPTGEIEGVYSITGRLIGVSTENLPRGIYLIRRTDGTEKYIAK